jgi:hypothetical protein
MTLTDFLLARTAEVERWSQAFLAVKGSPGVWARWSVAQCEATRKIVKGMEPFGPIDDIAAPEILGILAAVYADHPDYDPEWAPDEP